MTAHPTLIGRLRTGVPQLGIFVKLPSLESCEIVARSGIDFVVIDSEHAPLSVRDIYQMVVVFSALGVPALVRVSDHGNGDGQRLLDSGAAGLLVPHIQNAAEARQVFDQYRFPPLGSRGQGSSSRAGLWGGLDGGLTEYVRVGQEEVLRVAMIEDEGAVDEAAAIASTDAVNAIFVGPADLSLSMGVSPNGPEFEAALEKCIRAGVKAGVFVGTVAGSEERTAKLVRLGCHFLMVGNDTGVFASGIKRLIETSRERLSNAMESASGESAEREPDA